MDNYYYDDAAVQAAAAFMSVLMIICLIFMVVYIIALWKIFSKAGIAGWKSIIPFYNSYCLCKITWGSGWLFLVYWVPFVNFVFGILTFNRLAKVFGKGIGFTLGLIFLSPIFILILAFGSATYEELPAL